MKATRGQANAALVQAAVRERLDADERRRAERWASLNVVLWLGGVALIAIGYTRARGPWSRYQALKAQDANVARYEAWRGGVRDDGTTGRLGRDGDPAPPGADGRPDRDRSGSSWSSSGFLVRLARGERVAASGPRRPRRTTADEPPPLDRGAAVHHDGQPAIVRDPGRLPVHDAELQPEAAGARRRPPRARGARTARTAGRRRRCRTARSPRRPRRGSGTRGRRAPPARSG